MRPQALVALAVLAGGGAVIAAITGGSGGAVFPTQAGQVPFAARVAPLSFGWPLRPFDRPHPIRATFGEPRGLIGINLPKTGAARAVGLAALNQVQPVGTRMLHTGVDIVARDGTPVYAVESGIARTVIANYDTHVIVGRFGYWHLASPVPNGTRVVAFQTVIGHVYPGQRHVHLTRFGADWVPVNPLVAGGLVGFRDTAAPRLGRLRIYAPDGRKMPRNDVHGRVALVMAAADVQSDGGYLTGLYRLSYSLTRRGASRPAVGPVTVFQMDRLNPSDTHIGQLLYTVSSTRHGTHTRFSYRLTALGGDNQGFLDTSRLQPGVYRLTVRAAGAFGNATTSRTALVVRGSR